MMVEEKGGTPKHTSSLPGLSDLTGFMFFKGLVG
jgi:hypothetical protein